MTGLSRTRRWAALAPLCLAVLLVAVDSTVLSLALPFLTENLEPSSTEVLWIGDAYAFVLAGLLVTMGVLGDRWGRKRLLLCGAIAFAATSALAAYAPTPELLVVARALLGVGGATLMPSTLSIIRNIFTDGRERTLAVGIWSAMGAGGAALGPIVGGFLLEHFWWGSVFLINLPVMGVLLVVGFWLLPESRDPRPGRLDLLSVVLSMLGVTGVIYAIKEISVGALTHPSTPIAGVMGIAALVWFVSRQLRLKTPLLDVTLFRNRGFSSAVGVNMVAVFALSGLVFFLSQYLQFVLGLSPLEAGLRMLPATVGAIVAAVLVSKLVGWWGGGPVTAVGLGLTSVALALLSLLHVETSGILLLGGLAVIGVGVGAAITVTSDVILTAAPKEKAGAAAAVSETSYELGAALGIALLGSLLSAVYRGALALPTGLPAGVRDAAEDSVGGAVSMAHRFPQYAPELLTSAREAFISAIMMTVLVSAVVVAFAALLALLLPGRRQLSGAVAPSYELARAGEEAGLQQPRTGGADGGAGEAVSSFRSLP
ncbi:MAG: MFS transporter [Streptosporangiales bacterium]|nr:MFS transporter [Streptosporangiales bacterium]